jgi:putative tryptophan/tyrosine transport system substrate-binding protein
LYLRESAIPLDSEWFHLWLGPAGTPQASAFSQPNSDKSGDAVAGLSRFVILHEPGFPPSDLELEQVKAAAASMNLQVQQMDLNDLATLDGFLVKIVEQHSQALFVGSSGWFEDIHQLIVNFALKTRLPALFVRREYADIGGMMVYGIPYPEMYRNAANYIAKILRRRRSWDLARGAAD